MLINVIFSCPVVILSQHEGVTSVLHPVALMHTSILTQMPCEPFCQGLQKKLIIKSCYNATPTSMLTQSRKWTLPAALRFHQNIGRMFCWDPNTRHTTEDSASTAVWQVSTLPVSHLKFFTDHVFTPILPQYVQCNWKHWFRWFRWLVYLLLVHLSITI